MCFAVAETHAGRWPPACAACGAVGLWTTHDPANPVVEWKLTDNERIILRKLKIAVDDEEPAR